MAEAPSKRKREGSAGANVGDYNLSSNNTTKSSNEKHQQVQEQNSNVAMTPPDDTAAGTTTTVVRSPPDSRLLEGSTRLRKGMVIIKRFLSAHEQKELTALVRCLGEAPRGGFYSCNNEKTKRMKMMNLGLRTDGRKHALEIPREWKDMAVRAGRLAAEVDPSIPIPRPDICVVNYYTPASRLGWHQDLFSSRDPGLPVISLSLGQSATFNYRLSWKKTAGVKSVTLESGDALVFGGRSRGIIHGVPGIRTTSSADDTSKPSVADVGLGGPVGAVAGKGVEPESCCTAVGAAGRVGGKQGMEEGMVPASTAATVPSEAAMGGRNNGDDDVEGSGCGVPDRGRYNLNFREL